MAPWRRRLAEKEKKDNIWIRIYFAEEKLNRWKRKTVFGEEKYILWGEKKIDRENADHLQGAGPSG